MPTPEELQSKQAAELAAKIGSVPSPAIVVPEMTTTAAGPAISPQTTTLGQAVGDVASAVGNQVLTEVKHPVSVLGDSIRGIGVGLLNAVINAVDLPLAIVGLPEIPTLDNSKTVVGGTIQSVSQFAGGLLLAKGLGRLTAGRFIKGVWTPSTRLGASAAVTKLATWAATNPKKWAAIMFTGADLLAFSGKEAMDLDWITERMDEGTARDLVTLFDPNVEDDNEFERRLHGVAQGAVFGTVLGVMFKAGGYPVRRFAQYARNIREARKAAEAGNHERSQAILDDLNAAAKSDNGVDLNLPDTDRLNGLRVSAEQVLSMQREQLQGAVSANQANITGTGVGAKGMLRLLAESNAKLVGELQGIQDKIASYIAAPKDAQPLQLSEDLVKSVADLAKAQRLAREARGRKSPTETLPITNDDEMAAAVEEVQAKVTKAQALLGRITKDLQQKKFVVQDGAAPLIDDIEKTREAIDKIHAQEAAAKQAADVKASTEGVPPPVEIPVSLAGLEGAGARLKATLSRLLKPKAEGEAVPASAEITGPELQDAVDALATVRSQLVEMRSKVPAAPAMEGRGTPDLDAVLDSLTAYRAKLSKAADAVNVPAAKPVVLGEFQIEEGAGELIDRYQGLMEAVRAKAAAARKERPDLTPEMATIKKEEVQKRIDALEKRLREGGADREASHVRDLPPTEEGLDQAEAAIRDWDARVRKEVHGIEEPDALTPQSIESAGTLAAAINSANAPGAGSHMTAKMFDALGSTDQEVLTTVFHQGVLAKLMPHIEKSLPDMAKGAARRLHSVFGKGKTIEDFMESFEKRIGDIKGLDEEMVLHDAILQHSRKEMGEVFRKINSAITTGESASTMDLLRFEELHAVVGNLERQFIMANDVVGRAVGSRRMHGRLADIIPDELRTLKSDRGDIIKAHVTRMRKARKTGKETVSELSAEKADALALDEYVRLLKKAKREDAKDVDAFMRRLDSEKRTALKKDIESAMEYVKGLDNKADEVLKFYGGKEKVMAKFKEFMETTKGQGDNVKALAMQPAPARRLGDYLVAIAANGMLSSFRTPMTILVCNSLLSVVRPLEAAAGAALRMDLKEVGHHFAVLMETLHAYASMETWNAVWSTAKEGRSQLLRSMTPTRNTFGDGILGQIMGMPGKIVTASDEASKQVVFHAQAKVRLIEQGRAAGLEGKELHEFVEKNLLEAKSNPALYDQKGLTEAFEVSLTQSDPNSMVHKLNKLMAAHPWARILTESYFLNTTFKLAEAFGHRVPFLGAFRKNMISAIWKASAGFDASLGKTRAATFAETMSRQEIDRMVGEQLSGLFVGLTGFSLGAAGLITGSGPTDPKARKLWQTAGNEPYMIKIGGQWVSYRQLQPIGTLLAIAADLGRAQAAGERMDMEGANEAMASSKNAVMDMFWLTNFARTYKTLSEEGGGGLGKVVGRAAGNFTPFSALGRSLSYLGDNEARDPNSGWEAFLSQSGWGAAAVPPNRDVFTGEAITYGYTRALFPTYLAPGHTDDVHTYLSRWAGGIDCSVPRTLDGISIPSEVRDEWARTISRPVADQPSLMESMTKLIHDPQFEAMDKQVPPEEWAARNAGNAPQVRAINRIVSTYRRAALRKVMTDPEHDLFFASIISRRVQQKGMRAGITTHYDARIVAAVVENLPELQSGMEPAAARQLFFPQQEPTESAEE